MFISSTKDNDSKDTNVSKIVPSYNKKNTNVEKPKKIKSKITIYALAIITAIIIIGVTILVYNIILTNKYKSYVKYEEDMQKYGFNNMYDNKTASTYEKVTRSELVKIIVSSLLNKYSIDDIWKIENSEYDNQVWVDYAEQKGLIDKGAITKDNQNDKAKYIDAITILSKYKQLLLMKDLDVDSTPEFKDLNKYSNEQQTIIKDMIWNKIIENSSSKLNGNRNIVKGELNELIIKYVEHYNTITISQDDKLNINDEKLPYNYENYTYTLANVNKKVYEAKLDYKDVSKSILPRDMFIKYKDNIQEWIKIINLYYNNILNINYNTIDKENFKKSINLYVYNNYSENAINNYYNFVKENEIIIKGSASAQMPIIYYDGENIRIRYKLVYNILSSKVKENLLFGDALTNANAEYQNDSNVQYIDVELIPCNEDFKEVLICNNSVSKILVKNLQ